MKLSDTQAILLSTAAQRDSGSLYPLPEILIDAAAEEDDADPQDLIEAMNRSLVEDVGIHEDYRIVPDAIPAVCALYYDQVARFSSRSDAQARTWALLQEEKPSRRPRR